PLLRPHHRSSLFPYTTLFRSERIHTVIVNVAPLVEVSADPEPSKDLHRAEKVDHRPCFESPADPGFVSGLRRNIEETLPCEMESDRKSTCLNSSHVSISYAVF